jgi:hypothetical protein
MRTLGLRILAEARALRGAFPDADAMSELSVSAIPSVAPGDNDGVAEYRAALGYLRDEMLVVRAGRAVTLTVLDDEIACVERLLMAWESPVRKSG